jgi:predicted phage-related endonuclease
MSNPEIIAAITELQEYVRIKEEAEAAAEAIRDRLKAALGDTETMTAGPYKVIYREVTSSRIDSKRLTADYPDIAAAYSKTTTARPLKIY